MIVWEQNNLIVPLSVEQLDCTKAILGNKVVIAGPGSGKTTVILRRYLEMISTHGIPNQDILNLTFTREAALNMVNRIGLFGAEQTFRTFHSYALDLLQRERAFLPFTAGETILPTYGQDYQLKKDLLKIYPAITSYRALDDRLKEWKASNISPEQALKETYNDTKTNSFFYAAAYKDYEKKCREQGWLDFDSLVKETVKLLETNNDVRLRNVRKFICVDECQDTDVVQFRLLQLIYGGNIFVVGDEAQLIFAWRSAVAGSLSNFTKYFPGSDTLYLGTNYRSTGAIVDFLKRITPVDNGLASHMQSAREYGEKPVFVRFDSDLHEAEGILKEITDPEHSVVIARTNRLLRTVQRLALQKGIKTTILGRKNLWQREEVKHLLSLAKEYPDQHRPAYDVLTELQMQHNLTAKYANTGAPNDKPPVENIADFIRLSAQRGDLKTFLAWFNRLRYAKSSAKDPLLTLTTVHQAKGHEWKNVYVIGCKQGTMPHQDGEITEERRIFFVACSRAADRLQISYWGNRSEFLNDFQET